MRIARFLACGGMIAAVLLACKSKKAPPVTMTASPATVAGREYKLSVLSARQCEVKQEFHKPAQGSLFLGVELHVEVTADVQLSVYSYMFTVTDAAGRSYRPEAFPVCEPEIETGRLVEKHRSVRGWITFEVPENTTALKLAFNQHRYPGVAPDVVTVDLRR